MHPEQYGTRYTPTSPLSPKLPASHQHISPQGTRPRAQHSRQASKNMHVNLPRYHPANFQHHDSVAAPSSTVQSPTITLSRVTAPVPLESPRLMREKQREFLERARLTSKIAASPLAVKPDAPRLGPLGSPKGPVTPLALEEGGDYFQVADTAKASPVGSPGAKSARSDASSGKEEGGGKSKSKKIRKTTEIHQ